jgi:hypothetical protein
MFRMLLPILHLPECLHVLLRLFLCVYALLPHITDSDSLRNHDSTVLQFSACAVIVAVPK